MSPQKKTKLGAQKYRTGKTVKREKSSPEIHLCYSTTFRFPSFKFPYLSNMDGGAVTVIQPDGMEYLRGHFSIEHHTLPQERAVTGLLAIAELDAVSPGHQFSAQIDIGAWAKD